MHTKESALGKTLFNLGMVVLMLVVFLGGITVFRPAGGGVAEGSRAQMLQDSPSRSAVPFSAVSRKGYSSTDTPAETLEARLAALSIGFGRLRIAPFHLDLPPLRFDIDLSVPIEIAYTAPGTSMMVLTEPGPDDRD